jgi:uncharacterized protein
MSASSSLFLLPFGRYALLHAPLHGLTALVNRTAAQRLRGALYEGEANAAAALDGLLATLRSPGELPPQPKSGPLNPAFLGLLPTRACNLGCRYCGFLTGAEGERRMDLGLARDAVNWYMETTRLAGQRDVEVHFFGGEPFCAPEVLDLVVPLARGRAAERGGRVRFEAITNGVYSEARARWAADNLDTIVLSFDGPAEIHDQHRPYRNGASSFESVARSAHALAQGRAALYFRCCVTAQTVSQMPAIAAWFGEHFAPRGVSFEPVQPSAETGRAGLEPPDPWDFAAAFIAAARVLEAYGLETVCAAADIRTRRVSFCPVGQDVPIVSPDGTVSACYLLPHAWEAQGMDLRLGRLENGAAQLDATAVAATRALNVWHKPLCAKCFCRWHCAGGCHVQHHPGATYTERCLQTRAIALRSLLKSLDHDTLMDDLLQDREALAGVLLAPSDLLQEAA